MRVDVPFKGVADLPDAKGASPYNPSKPTVRAARPPKRLAAFQRTGQIEI